MYFYGKHVYVFHNEGADSWEPQREHKLFSWNLDYQNIYSNPFYGHYNYQNNSLGKLVWNKSEAPVIFVTSKVAPAPTFNRTDNV